MSAPNTLLLPVSGMQPDYGPFTTAPSGALMDARNVQMRVPGVVEPRGSFRWNLDATTLAANQGICLGCFSDFAGAHTFKVSSDGAGTNVLRRDDTSTVTGSPAANPTKFTEGKVFYSHAMSQDYFTSDQGVYVLNNPSTTARTAGMPRPVLYPDFSTNAYVDCMIGYRAVFVKNPNTYPIYSPPSGICYTGTSSTAVNTSVACLLDTSCLSVGDQVQIYRSVQVTIGPNTAMPLDEMRLRYTFTLTSAHLAAGGVVFYDQKLDSEWSGPSLYSNATQQGAAQASWRPGLTQDISYYNNMMFYGGMSSRQRFVTTLSSAIASYTATSGYEQVWGAWNFTSSITSGSNVVTPSGSNISKVFVGQEFSCAQFTGLLTVTSVGGSTFTVSGNANSTLANAVTEVRDYITVTANAVDYTIKAAISASGYVPVAIGNTYWTAQPAWYESKFAAAGNSGINLYADATNSTDRRLGIQLFFESKTVDGAAFTVKSSKPQAFDKYIDSTGISSKRDYQNPAGTGSAYLFYSKPSQPESVPLGNFVIIGDEQCPIVRIMATKEALWVFKTDGVWRVSGDDPSSLHIDQFDPTLQMFDNAPLANTVERFDNDVFAWTTRGIFRISDGGAQPIDTGIRQWMLEQGYGNFDDVTYAFTAHSQVDRWVMFCPRFSATPTVSRMFVYWPDSDVWSYWTSPDFSYNFLMAAGGHVRTTGHDDVMFASGFATVSYRWDPTEVESSSTIANQLCADQLVGCTTVSLSAVSGTSATSNQGTVASAPLSPQVGDAILQGGNVYYVTSIAGANFTVDRAGLVNGAVTKWFSGFTARVLWSATPGAGLGVQTHFDKATFAFDQVRGGQNFIYQFRGYQNQTLTSSTVPYYVRDASNTPQTQDASFGVPSGIPVVNQVVIPSNGPRKDWGIQAGFQTTQAGQYFRINGCAIHWDPIDTKVTR